MGFPKYYVKFTIILISIYLSGHLDQWNFTWAFWCFLMLCRSFFICPFLGVSLFSQTFKSLNSRDLEMFSITGEILKALDTFFQRVSSLLFLPITERIKIFLRRCRMLDLVFLLLERLVSTLNRRGEELKKNAEFLFNEEKGRIADWKGLKTKLVSFEPAERQLILHKAVDAVSKKQQDDLLFFVQKYREGNALALYIQDRLKNTNEIKQRQMELPELGDRLNQECLDSLKSERLLPKDKLLEILESFKSIVS